MKLISFTVPCYNSAEYMRKCIDSLLTGGDDVEIIIINDGSKDDTLKIAQEYSEKHPDTVSVVDKENGGHGSGVNAGLKRATGLYFKVVDSDDWLDTVALEKLISAIKANLAAGNCPDLYIANFIYDRIHDGEFYVSSYEKKMPEGKIIGWERVKPFRYSHMMLMHALLYNRERLLESGTVLPEHTFYVDNIFAYKPLPYTKSLCYLNLDLYHYYIGRADQSVTVGNMVSRYMQQRRVMLEMTDAYSWDEIRKLPQGLKKYMWHSLQTIMMTTLFFICAEYSPERKAALKDMWRHIKARDKKLYRKLYYRSYAAAVNFLSWRVRGYIMTKSYKILCRKVKLG